MGRTVTEWVLQLIDNITSPMNSVQDAADAASDSVNDVVEAANDLHDAGSNLSDTVSNFGAIAFAVNQISDAVGKFNQEFQGLIAPGVELQTQMADLSAVTQKTGDDLDVIKGRAKDLAAEFGGSASQQAESFKTIIAKFGPDIADSDQALGEMGKSIAILSKSMGGDAAKAANALTGAMLQYGVDLTNPIEASEEMYRIMNLLVAGGIAGASEVSDTADALKVVGLTAKQQGVSLEEFTATMQGLAAGELYGAEAGTKLRNVLTNIASESMIPKNTVDALKEAGVDMSIVTDNSKNLTDRMRELSKVSGSDLIMQMFGANSGAAEVLMERVDQIDTWRQEITDTTAAVDAADTNMNTYAETMSRINGRINNFKASIFDAIEPIAPFISIGGDAITTITNMGIAVWGLSVLLKKDLWLGIGSAIKGISSFIVSCATGSLASIKFGLASLTSFSTFKAAAISACTTVSTAIYSIPIIGWIALAIAAIAALVAYFYNTSATFRGFLLGIGEAVKTVFGNIGRFIAEVLIGCHEIIKAVFNPANWFNDEVSITAGFEKIANAAKTYGEEIGKAFAQGRDDGIADFEKSKTEKESAQPTPGKFTATELLGQSGNKNTNIVSGNENGNKTKGLNLSGSGSGSGKSITMNVTMNNYMTGLSIDEMVNKVCRQINDRLSDSLAMQ